MLFEARSKTYTKKNVEKAFDTAGIHPINAWKVINKAHPPPTAPTTTSSFTLSTPHKTRDVNRQVRELLTLISPSNSAARDWVLKLGHSAEAAISDIEIQIVTNQQLRNKLKIKIKIKSISVLPEL